MKGAPRIAAGLLGMISAPAACMFLSPALLPAALLFPLLGCVRWGLKWLPVIGVFCMAPLVIAAWSQATGREGATLVSLRWALSTGAGLYFARRTGAASLGRLLIHASSGLGRAGGFMEDSGNVLIASGSLRKSMKGRRILGTPPSIIFDCLNRAIGETAGNDEEHPIPDRTVFFEAATAWALLLAGIAGS